MRKLLTHVAMILLTACLTIGCGGRHYPQSLLTADSLAEVQPDSSLKMLEAMASEMATAPETDQMYYRLLRIKASDKCDRLQPDTMEITQIVDYYEQMGDSLLPTAYYYAGRTYYDLQDMPQALEYYQKAVDAIGDRQTRSLLLLKEVCYSQMGYIFYYQKLYEQAEDMHIKEISTAQLLNDTLGLAYGYRDLGFIYSESENYKDAISTLKTALIKAHSCNNDKLEFVIKSYMANVYRHLGDYDSALYYLRPVIDHVHLLSKSSVYSNAAKIYHDKGEADSALYYFRQLEMVGVVYAKENAYKHLLQDAINRKNFADVSNYYHNYLLYSDSVKKITQTEAVARTFSQYKFQKKMSITAVRDSNIYRHFISMADHEHPTEKDWNNLESLLNKECDNFCDKLKTLCKLKPIAYRISMLIKIGVEPTQMAQLLNTSKQNISTTKSRLYREIFGKKGCAKDWDEFVKSI